MHIADENKKYLPDYYREEFIRDEYLNDLLSTVLFFNKINLYLATFRKIFSCF